MSYKQQADFDAASGADEQERDARAERPIASMTAANIRTELGARLVARGWSEEDARCALGRVQNGTIRLHCGYDPRTVDLANALRERAQGVRCPSCGAPGEVVDEAPPGESGDVIACSKRCDREPAAVEPTADPREARRHDRAKEPKASGTRRVEIVLRAPASRGGEPPEGIPGDRVAARVVRGAGGAVVLERLAGLDATGGEIWHPLPLGRVWTPSLLDLLV